MQATEILMDEHRIIEQVLDALEGMAVVVEQENSLPIEDARQAVAFLRGYADKFHHAKEEDLLFAELEAVGFSRQNGPVAVMLYEHDAGRALVGKMAAAIEQTVAGVDGAAQVFVGPAREFAALLRGHIQKENNILYVMANEMLPEERKSSLVAAFAQADERMGGWAGRMGFITCAASLASRYAARSPYQDQAACDGCGQCG